MPQGSKTSDLPIQDSVAESLAQYQPERYWAVWQIPEGRYAYSVDLDRTAWLIALDSEGVGLAYLLSDARQNDRAPSDYRLDELTLPDAFDAARAQAVPFRTSFGTLAERVLGIVLIAPGGAEGSSIRHIPL